MFRTFRRQVIVVAAVGLLAAACSETTTTSETTAAPTSAAPETTTGSTTPSTDTAAPSTDAAGPSAAVKWALDYVGGTAGAVSGDPVKIGFASSSDLAPDAEVAVDATADYVNKNLGGIGGRPLEIVHCNMAVAEDGAKCATQFANDNSIVLAVVGQALAGNADFYSTIAGKKPVYTAAPSGLDDFISTTSVSYYAGALGAAFGIAGYLLEDVKPKTMGFVITDDAAGRGGYAVLEPVLKSQGAVVTPVFVPPTATAPEVESALQAIGQVDAIVIGLFEQGCIAAYDALKNIGVDATVTPIVAVSPCHGAAMQQHMADAGESGILPNGWYFSGNGYNPFVGDAASGEDTMIDVFAAAGKPEVAFAVGAEEVVGGTMTMVKHLNAAAGDYSFATLDAAIRGFKGPVMAAAGPMACGAPPVFKGICAGRSSISRYIDGKWEATREGDNAVDISPYVAPAG